jgi:HD-GYP domain-containing protein (c-di-GMP phosphodiesterase class II)
MGRFLNADDGIPKSPAQSNANDIRLAELLAALSVATDLAMAFPPETALRTCMLGVQIGRELRLPEQQLEELFYVTLLRHVGCTAFSHEEGIVVGDDNAVRRDFTGIDRSRPVEVAATAIRRLGAGEGPLGRVRVITAAVLAADRLAMPRIVAAHCDASASLARLLGMTEGVIEALNHIFERWDGKGDPLGLKGEAIALSARVTHFSHTVVLETWRRGASGAREMVRRRAGGEFDPTLAQVFLARSPELMESVNADSVWDAVLAAEPASGPWLPASRIDAVAQAFAFFSDLKSPYTLGHCQAVARLADAAGRALSLADIEVQSLRRAALLHHLGRVAIANGIWDKRGLLNAAEWERLRLYPYHTERIVSRAPALRPLATLAASVQERLDGSGYHRGVPAALLSTGARVLAAADAYQAMTEERPHRPALVPQVAARELRAEVEAGRLDREAVNAVLEFAGHGKASAGRNWPADLTDREVEVLRQVAQAKPNKVIAQTLVISDETVRNHVRHIYEKIGVSSRAGAALFAMEHDLIRK